MRVGVALNYPPYLANTALSHGPGHIPVRESLFIGLGSVTRHLGEASQNGLIP